MVEPSMQPAWWGSLLWLLGVAAAAFLVAWASGTRLHIRRTLYVAILTIVTGTLSAGYVAWLGVGLTDVLTNHWAWGLLAAAVSGGILTVLARRQPVVRRLHGRELTRALAWQGVVYGTAEGVLLSALPPFIAWQMVDALGWTGAGGAIARWALPILAGAVVVLVHHLGYWNCRNRILVPITLGLSLLATAFLISASWLAPAVGHIVVHVGLLLHGSEMPPIERPAPAPSVEEAHPLPWAA